MAGSFYSADELRDRLSISTLVFRGFRPICEAALNDLRASGIRRIELIESPEQFDMTSSESMKRVGDVCNTSGVEIGAYHCYKTNFNHVESESVRKERVDTCKRQIDTMLELGGNLWGCHAAVPNAMVRKSYEELADHVEGTDASVTIENFAREGVNVHERIDFLDDFDHPKVGMILDIGHVRDAEGKNPMTEPGGPTKILERCGHRLRHVHLHGFKDGRDHNPPLVEGDEIQWVELFSMLRDKEYSGHINFEPAGEPRAYGSIEHAGAMPERLVELASG